MEKLEDKTETLPRGSFRDFKKGFHDELLGWVQKNKNPIKSDAELSGAIIGYFVPIYIAIASLGALVISMAYARSN